MNIDKVFIYPTDTIYGIGCNAENIELVERIRIIKNRDSKPMSVIAPSFDWILKNFKTNLEFLKKYLPGPYTLILEKKNLNFLNHVSETNTLGIRIPNNEFTKKLQEFGKPIITTSVNLSGKPFAIKLSDIDKKIIEKVDFVIEGNKLSGKPSTIVFENKIIER